MLLVFWFGGSFIYLLYGECFLWLKKSLLPQGPEDIFIFYSRNLIVLSFTFRLMIIWNGICFVCCEAGIKDYFSPVVTEWIQHRLLKRPSSFPFCKRNNGPQRCPHSILILEFVILQLYTEKGILQKKGLYEGSSDAVCSGLSCWAQCNHERP